MPLCMREREKGIYKLPVDVEQMVRINNTPICIVEHETFVCFKSRNFGLKEKEFFFWNSRIQKQDSKQCYLRYIMSINIIFCVYY